MLQLFTDAFWHSPNHSHTLTSLHPPKSASWPFWYFEHERQFLPMPFEVAEQYFGPERARELCSVEARNDDKRPVDDGTGGTIGMVQAWFGDLDDSDESDLEGDRYRN